MLVYCVKIQKIVEVREMRLGGIGELVFGVSCGVYSANSMNVRA